MLPSNKLGSFEENELDEVSNFQHFRSSAPRKRLIENQEQLIHHIPNVPKLKKKKTKEKTEKKEVEEDGSRYRDRAKERRMNDAENDPLKSEIKGLDIDLYYQRKKAIEEDSKSYAQLQIKNLVKENLPVDQNMESDVETSEIYIESSKLEDSKSNFKTRLGRNVYHLLFENKKEEIPVDYIVPERTYYLFNIDNNNKTRPIIIERSDDEIPMKFQFDDQPPNQDIIKKISEALKRHSDGEKSRKRKNLDKEDDLERVKQAKIEEPDEAIDDIDMFGDDDDE